MNSLYNDLLSYIIQEEVKKAIGNMETDIKSKTKLLAIEILTEIQTVLARHYELSDFQIVEKIVCIMERDKIDCGACHDFG